MIEAELAAALPVVGYRTAMRFAERIVLLHRGKLAMDGSPRQTVTAETIRRIFEIETEIQFTENGTPFLLPQTMQRLTLPPGPR